MLKVHCSPPRKYTFFEKHTSKIECYFIENQLYVDFLRAN